MSRTRPGDGILWAALVLVPWAALTLGLATPVGAQEGTPPPAVEEEQPASATAPEEVPVDHSAGAAPPPAEGPWSLPAEGSCQPEGGLIGHPGGEDATETALATGDVYTVAQLEVLRNYLPRDFWLYRERFFYEGMRLEIGPCFRDYSAPDFVKQATEAHRGQASLTDRGGLVGYLAGEPFATDDVAADDPQAALKFAWNMEHRYQAAGFMGKFRRVDLLGRVGRAEPFEGEIFKVLLSHRADRPDGGYALPFANDKHWVAGGLFFKPFNSREFAWRQYRDVEHETEPRRTDDLHAYLPQWRRVRRISAANLEGLYMPAPSVGVKPSQQIALGAGGGDAAGGGIAAAGGANVSGGSITPKNTGFEGLELRPLLYEYRVLGLHDVIAPLNLRDPLYPQNPDREFGPWGLSFASDRWDVRRALVLEATAKDSRGGEQAARMVHYLDLQTYQPLYYMSFDSRGERIDVGYFVGRWSEDREDYPAWPDDPDRPARVIDPVGAAFANLSERGSWRRESWDVVGIPPSDSDVKKMISVGNLTRRR